MPNYLVELYRPDSDADSLRGSTDRLTATARELSREGIPVRHLDTIFLPTDETCLHLFEADSEDDVRALAHRAGIDVDRIVRAEQVGLPHPVPSLHAAGTEVSRSAEMANPSRVLGGSSSPMCARGENDVGEET